MFTISDIEEPAEWVQVWIRNSTAVWCKIVQIRVTSTKFGKMIELCTLSISRCGATPQNQYFQFYWYGFNYPLNKEKTPLFYCGTLKLYIVMKQHVRRQ